MMNTLTTTSADTKSGLTMSSREIATLTGKAHKNVLADIRAMLESLGLHWADFSAQYKDSTGRNLPEARLPKRETLILVSGYDMALRARIVDRWIELETEAQKPASSRIANDAREARLSFNQYMRISKMLGLTGNQAVLSASRAVRETVGIDMLGAMGMTHLPAPSDAAAVNVTTMGQHLGLSPRAVNDALSRHGYQTFFRDSKQRLVYEPTKKGRAAGGHMADTGKKHGNGTPVTQLIWSTDTVAALRADLQKEAA